jgi:SHS2 domain-containing protein
MGDVQQELGVEVKGATYTELKVSRRDGSWIAECVVDV